MSRSREAHVMLEFTGFATVLRGLGYLYWLAAIGLLMLAIWKGKDKRRKVIWASIVVAVFGFLPVKLMLEQYRREAFAKQAWAYFKKLCDEKSGEKIYKTFTGVKSVLVIKPLPPATEKDLYDQYWYGDPYSRSATSERAEYAAKLLTMDSRRSSEIQKGLDFVEMKDERTGNYVRIFRPAANDKFSTKEIIDNPVSQFGVAWEDISTPMDRTFWVAGSRLQVVNLSDNSVIAERIGYFIEAGFGSRGGGRRPWLTSRGPNTTCPPLHGGDYSDTWFIANVFKLDKE